jgi:hypothetical protein
MLLAACSPSVISSADCVNFPELEYQMINRVYDLPDADQTLPAIISARQKIIQCYPKMAHDTAAYPLIPMAVGPDDNQGYVLTYGLDGVSDVAIAFRADHSGHIIEAFEYSTM